MQDSNQSTNSTTTPPDKKMEASEDTSIANKDILEVTEMEQSPEHSASASASDGEGETAVESIEIEQPPEPEPPLPLEFAKYWKDVEDNPEEFTNWIYLLQYVEQENHIFAARRSFDLFFLRYPYCYGYWKKYADMEKKHNNVMEADEVYRKGIQAIPLSVDLWIHYLNFLKETLDPADPETSNTLRGTFEHAALTAGMDYRSDKLWEMYITWETEQRKLSEVTSVYSRLLGIPTQLYADHFQRFREHIQGNLPRDFLTPEKFVELRKELASVNEHGVSNADIPSGLEEITDPAKLTTEVENMRHRIIEVHQEIFNLNEHEISKRWSFEDGYAKYMESQNPEGVRHVYIRACTIHLVKKPMVNLLWAAFEEQQGNLEESRSILKTFEENVEGLAMVRLRRVSLERRHGNVKEAENLLQEAMKNAKSSSESSFYAIKLARHLFKVQKNVTKAREVLSEAIQKDKENTKLYLNLLEMEYNGDLKQNEGNIIASFDKAIKSSMSVGMRITFSQRKVEFLEDFGSDVNKLLDTYDEHQKLLKEQELYKRKAENGLEQSDLKRAHIDETAVTAATPITVGSTDATQTAYNYSNWYQYQNYQNAWNYGQYYHPPPT
ncbi:hypothetical protein FKM82_016574 [Ascaphus truei]